MMSRNYTCALFSVLLFTSCQTGLGTNAIVNPQPSPSPSDFSVVAKNSQIRSAIQVFKLNSEGNGIILWREGEELYPRILKGNLMVNGQSDRAFSLQNISALSTISPIMILNTSHQGVLAWTDIPGGLSTGIGESPLFYRAEINSESTNANATLLGNYRLHNHQVDQQGNGFLVVSNEKSGRALADMPFVSVFLVPVNNSKIPLFQENDLKNVVRLPVTEAQVPFVASASIDLQGNGTLFFTNLKNEKYYRIQIKNFQGLDAIQEGDNGNPNTNSFSLGDIPPYYCRFGNDYLAQTGWHYILDDKGNGYFSTPTEGRKQITVQKILNFQRSTQKQIMNAPMDVCMTRIQLDAQQNPVVASLSTECPEQNCGSNHIEAEKMVWLKKLDKNSF
ncbi:MAG: hypothetical protein ACO1RX_23765 [Candidatus Sericytochromatia bacterium]